MGLCHNEVSRYLVAQMSFMTDEKQLRMSLQVLSEMMEIRAEGTEIPSFHFGELRSALIRIRPEGSYLEVSSLRPLRDLLQSVVAAKQCLMPLEGSPLLRQIAGRLIDLVDIRRRLNNILSEDGGIKDTASHQLNAIRQELRDLQSSLGKTMQSILREAQSAGWVEATATPTMRDGRLLLPIIPSAKREIDGIVHEESATGRTLYLEPAQMVVMNNKIRQKQSEEEQEVKRILKEFTLFVRENISIIQGNCNKIGLLDFNHAKALFAEQLSATVPHISREDAMEWQVARHPILERHLNALGRMIVPLTIRLNPENRILLISGPNAGGKSIALKTVGLLQYMLQCGMAIPMMPHSTCRFFDAIFLDIGDAQSLENDLSTYSSHLQYMKTTLRESTKDSLVLIDEFGSGTEPAIGGAIAQAILEQLRLRECFGVITTHYGNLKDYAEKQEGIVNGAMLFDRGRIEPLYELFIGQPGSSFGIEVAKKIGLPTEIIDYASQLVGTDYLQQDKFLQDIIRDKAYWKRKREEVKREERILLQKQEKLDRQLDSIAQKRKGLIDKAEKEALDIVSGANATIERTIKEIKEANANKAETQIARAKLEKKRQHLRRKQQKPQTSRVDKELIVVGSRVTLKQGNEVGEVISIEGQKAKVQMGILTMDIALDRLTPTEKMISKVANRPPQVIQEQSNERRLNFKPQLDCRGMRVDEALSATTQFIDDAVHFGYSPVRILHGTGTGALKEAISEYLKTNSAVTHFEEEHVDLGGAGITVVTL